MRPVLVAVGMTVAAACVDPTDPVRAVRAVLALPNRQPRLDAVDEAAAGDKRLLTMRCTRGADHCGIANDERARSVRRLDADAWQLARDLVENTSELGLGHRSVRLVLEQLHDRKNDLVERQGLTANSRFQGNSRW